VKNDARAAVVALVGTWGKPPDMPAKIALALALAALLAALVGRGRALVGAGPQRLGARAFLGIAALAAALLSVAYTAIYLRGGPRIVDATTYWLQGRAMQGGEIAFPVPFPSASFRGRFLLAATGAGGTTLAGIFPPGYPLLLSLGFALGAPMIVGPLLAAAMVVATYRLARVLAEEHGDEASVEPAARVAALLSVACAALRYHTADTMAHGATALGIAVALERALVAAREGSDRPRRGRGPALGLGLGLALGAIAATRPVSALGVGVVAAALLARSRGDLARAALGAAPGFVLLALGQHAATGEWLASSQRAYYAGADGPLGCFRWGFGAGVGCLHEHGEFVRARLPAGYGLLEAAGTTARRLHLHLGDVANFEPLALLALGAPLLPALRSRGTRAALAVVALHVLAYAPFYFDGNYPGGGARLFADVLPVEHALLASCVVVTATRWARRRPGADPDRVVARACAALVGLTLFGFAVHAAHAHGELAVRAGGRPMYEPDVVTRARVTEGLVFVDTDHAFGLAHVPGASTLGGLVVARLREDDHDGLLHERLGKPPTWRYTRGLEEPGKAPVPATLVPYTPPVLGSTLRFEGESDWPPLAQEGGFAAPAWTDACASNGRALVLTPDASSGARGVARATLALPVPAAGRYRLTVRVVHGARLPFTGRGERPEPTASAPLGTGRLFVAGRVVAWSSTRPSAPSGVACEDLAPIEVDIPMGLAASGATASPRAEIPIVLEASNAPVALDRLLLERLP
jgi:hypothetical protein